MRHPRSPGKWNFRLRSSSQSDARLRKHADYQRVYQRSRKHFSTSMTYFFAGRGSTPRVGPRVGLTAGRVMGKAVDRNRIKRRMREAVRMNLTLLTWDVDVVLHPRRTVLTVEFTALQSEVSRIFAGVEKAREKAAGRGRSWTRVFFRIREERCEFGIVPRGADFLLTCARDLRVSGQAAVCNKALHILKGVRAVAFPAYRDAPTVRHRTRDFRSLGDNRINWLPKPCRAVAYSGHWLRTI